MDKKTRLMELYELAQQNDLVKSKREFGAFIGVDSAAISHALKNDGKFNEDNMVTRAEHALMKAGVILSGGQKLPSLEEAISMIAELRETIRRQQREIDGLYERIDELKRGTALQDSVVAG